MTFIKKLYSKISAHPELSFDVLRMYLGLGLFFQGGYFLKNIQLFDSFLNQVTNTYLVLILAHYIVFAHICGGILLALGLITRISAAIQFPILVGAMLFVHAPSGLFSDGFPR